jgi:hypothetical protein
MLASSFSDVELPELPEIEGLISASERRYLYRLTREHYTGQGSVVEIGSWFGCSSIHLAAGLRDAGHKSTVNCFDDFGLLGGPNSLDRFLSNTSLLAEYLKPTKSLIRDLKWTEPIEILFLDAPKTWTDLADVFRIFGQHLIPGISLISIQDYLFFPAYPIAVAIERLEKCFTLEHVVTEGSTVTFRMKQSLPLDVADMVRQPPDWGHEECSERWDHILKALPANAVERLQPALPLLLEELGYLDAAQSAARQSSLSAFQTGKWLRHFGYLSKKYPYTAGIMRGRLKYMSRERFLYYIDLLNASALVRAAKSIVNRFMRGRFSG